MTKVNNPNVSIVSGNVKSKSAGFMKAFRTPKRTATTIAVTNESTRTPDRTYALMKTAALLTSRLIRMFT